jgi:phosphatidylinositol alpha-1,6-mannosyltransferase
VDSGRIVVVHPGVSLPPPEPGVNDFRERFELNGRPLLLSVGRLIARKGLLEFVENALPAIVAAHTDVCLIVLGEETPDLLQGNSIGLRTRILQRARDLGLTHNLRFIGPQDDNTLALAYRAADVHVFPVRDIPADVEGFGMVAIEAAAHGLPTVAFAVGGVPDAVNDGVSGTLVRPGDYAQFVASVLEWLGRRGDSGVRERASHFASQFSWALFGAQINENLRKLVQP